MMLCRCGGNTRVLPTKRRPQLDNEMGTLTRVRECIKCERRKTTVELGSDELSALRAAAFRERMNEVWKLA